MKKIWPHPNNIAGQVRSISVGFLDYCRDLLPHQNLMNDGFLKVNCCVKSKTITEQFLCCYYTGLYFWVDILLMYSYTITRFVIRKQFTELCKSCKCWHCSFYAIKNGVHLTSLLPLEQTLSIGKLVDSWWHQVSNILIFAWRLNFTIHSKYCQFSLKWQHHYPSQ